MCGGSHYQSDVATIGCRTVGHHTPNMLSPLLMRPTLFTQSNPQPHFQFHKIVYSNYIRFVLLASIYNIKYYRRTNIACFGLWGNVMKDRRKINIKAREFQVNTKQRGTNKQQGKNAKWGCEELRIWKPQVQKDLWNWFGRFMKLLEVYHLCQVSLEESWTNLEGSWNW